MKGPDGEAELIRSEEYTNIDLGRLVAVLTAEFPESRVDNHGWVLFRVGDLMSFEIDAISGFMIARTSVLIGPEYPMGNGTEFEPTIKKLRKMVKLKKSLIETGFSSAASGVKEDNRYAMKFVKPVETTDIEKIISDIKEMRSMLGSVR